MGMCFMPGVTATLQSIDATRFASVTCATCHGADYNGGTYEMPAGLDLSWADAGSWDAAYFDASTGAGGMTDLLVQAADLLGEEPWSKTNKDGFACANCHVGL